MKIFWIGGLTSPSTKKITDEIIKKIEEKIEKKLEIIEYAEFSNENIKRLKNSLSIEEYAKKAIKSFQGENSNTHLILIGCSMGGLIARYLIEKMGLKVKGLILLATPNKGINLSPIERFGLKIIGPIPCVEDMRPGSNFLKLLGDPPSEKYYYFFGGTNDSRVTIDSSLPTKNSRSILVNTGHKDMVNTEIIIKIVSVIKSLMLASN